MSKEPRRNVYVGHRYVPLLMEEWDKTISYEGLSIVTYQGASYTSKKRVPIGVDILNEEYWVVTGNYNAQIEHYRQDVRNLEKHITSEVERVEGNVASEFTRIEKELNDNYEEFTHDINEEVSTIAQGLSHNNKRIDEIEDERDQLGITSFNRGSDRLLKSVSTPTKEVEFFRSENGNIQSITEDEHGRKIKSTLVRTTNNDLVQIERKMM